LKIKDHIPEIHSDFYKDVFQWPTTTADGDDSDYGEAVDGPDENNQDDDLSV
jgi:hypothetical protein